MGSLYSPFGSVARARGRAAVRQQNSLFVERSRELQRLPRAAGYAKGDGVSAAGLQLVTTLARDHGLRDWPNTQTVADYDALISAVQKHLAPSVPSAANNS